MFGELESEGIIMIAEFTDKAIPNPDYRPDAPPIPKSQRATKWPTPPADADAPPTGESSSPPG